MVNVTIDGMWKEFSDGTAIGPIDLEVRDGELIVLLGPSGSGKTTTLRMVAGFIRPDRGRLLFDDVNVMHVPPNERKIGMVVQSVALFPNMDVFQNIAFALEVREWPHEKVVRRVEELSDLVGIRNLLHRKITEISGGEGQRVALARALAHGPELLLLDEPLSALDPNLRESLQMEIRRIQKELRVTTIYVTHNQDEAFAIADRIAVLNEGVINQVGTPSDLYDRPLNRFVATFLGRGSILGGEVTSCDDKGFEVSFDGQTMHLPGYQEVGNIIELSVKPEDITVTRFGDDGLEATVESIVSQPGRYRVQLKIGKHSLHTFISANTLPEQFRPGERIRITIDPMEVAILADTSP